MIYFYSALGFLIVLGVIIWIVRRPPLDTGPIDRLQRAGIVPDDENYIHPSPLAEFPARTAAMKTLTINSTDAEKQFKAFVHTKGKSLKSLSAKDAISLMLEYYHDVCVKHCPVQEEGDMLLFQWELVEWGEKKGLYYFDITRQFIRSDQMDDDAITQLSLMLHFSLPKELQKIEDGDRWHDNPSTLAEFKQFIHGTEIFQAVKDLAPANVKLYFEGV